MRARREQRMTGARDADLQDVWHMIHCCDFSVQVKISL
jgi:hypothetical protein